MENPTEAQNEQVFFLSIVLVISRKEKLEMIKGRYDMPEMKKQNKEKERGTWKPDRGKGFYL